MADFDTGAFFRGLGKGAGKFAAGKGLIAVSTDFYKGSSLIRDPVTGFFISAQAEVAAAGRSLALELAESVADAAKASLLRPGVSTGRLQKALLHPKNRVGVKEGYGIGRPEFLDKSEAKYWRQIDQGYSGHVGREIRGVFGGTLTGAFGGQSRYGPYPLAGGPFTAIGAGSGGRLLPLGKKSAYAKLAKARKSGKRRLNAKVASTIEQPISAQQYFLRGWEDFNAASRTTAAVKAVLQKALPPAR